MRMSFRRRHAVSVCAALALLAGCGGGSPSLTTPAGSSSAMLPGSHLSPASRGKRKDLLACTSVQTSDGATYTVAHLGGGRNLDVESSAYANCEIGIYISPANRPYVLDQNMVNGLFGVGVYLDGAGLRIAHTLICVNGEIGGSCESGSSSSPGTGLYAQNTPNLKINKTRIDGYAAGFASSPCPNAKQLHVPQSLDHHQLDLSVVLPRWLRHDPEGLAGTAGGRVAPAAESASASAHPTSTWPTSPTTPSRRFWRPAATRRSTRSARDSTIRKVSRSMRAATSSSATTTTTPSRRF